MYRLGKYLAAVCCAALIASSLTGCVFALGNKGLGKSEDTMEKLEKIDDRLDRIEKQLDELEGTGEADGAELVSGAADA